MTGAKSRLIARSPIEDINLATGNRDIAEGLQPHEKRPVTLRIEGAEGESILREGSGQ